MTTPSKPFKSIPQRKAVALRRGLGMLALVGLLTLPQAASAQSRAPRGDGDRVEQQVSRLDQALDLTDAQATRLRGLFQAQESNRPERGDRQSGDREAMRAQREAQRAEMDRQIEAILTPAQSERFRALRAERQSEGRRGQRGQRDGR